MAVASTNTWISFFKDAGLPANIAATYALTFWNNRIQMDMLLDLNKEYLRDMGITVMGDIIAILRHAKMVHEETAREKILGDTHTRVVNVGSAQRNEKNTPAETKVPGTSSSGSIKKVARVPIQPITPTGVKKKVLKTKPSTALETTEKKIRRVLPEHEGRYKITMPSGSTIRSKEILAKMKTVPPPKKTVFDRLGNDGDVTSTTESESPRITITGLENLIVKNSGDKPSSVFSRLGEKSQVPSSTTVSTPKNDLHDDDDDDDDDDDNTVVHIGTKPLSDKTLPYAGILKQSSEKIIKTLPRKEASTMRADVEAYRGSFRRFTAQTVVAGASSTMKSPSLSSSAGVLARRVPQVKPNIKARLGFGALNSDVISCASVTKASISPNSNDDLGDGTTIVNKRVTFGGVTGVFGGNERFQFSHFRSDYSGRGRGGVRRGGFFFILLKNQFIFSVFKLQMLTTLCALVSFFLSPVAEDLAFPTLQSKYWCTLFQNFDLIVYSFSNDSFVLKGTFLYKGVDNFKLNCNVFNFLQTSKLQNSVSLGIKCVGRHHFLEFFLTTPVNKMLFILYVFYNSMAFIFIFPHHCVKEN
ncbi:uncharacterized protein GBIM_18318, partial [Gryllus bimaculatus]